MLAESVTLDKQVEVETPHATFRFDLVATTGNGYKVAFECDGKKYHKDALRDECRDALIFKANAASMIYRLRGADIMYRPFDCLYAVHRMDPCLISDRGEYILDRLASDEVKHVSYSDPTDLSDETKPGRCEDGWLTVYYPAGESERWRALKLERRSPRRRMQQFLNFAATREWMTFSDLYKKYREEFVVPYLPKPLDLSGLFPRLRS